MHAAVLLCASHALRNILSSPSDIPGSLTDSAIVTTILERLSHEQIETAISSGRRLTIEQAQTLALSALDHLSAQVETTARLPQ